LLSRCKGKEETEKEEKEKRGMEQQAINHLILMLSCPLLFVSPLSQSLRV
jgi:hypothetical protein